MMMSCIRPPAAAAAAAGAPRALLFQTQPSPAAATYGTRWLSSSSSSSSSSSGINSGKRPSFASSSPTTTTTSLPSLAPHSVVSSRTPASSAAAPTLPLLPRLNRTYHHTAAAPTARLAHTTPASSSFVFARSTPINTPAPRTALSSPQRPTTSYPSLSNSSSSPTFLSVQTRSHTMSAANPLADLLSHNEHWCSETCTKKPDLFKTCAAGQAPKVLWIGCSDSRVPESVITEADPGQIFVTRNIANQFNPEDDNVVSVLTYGVQALGVEHVVVVGHTSCGGMIAATGAAATGAAPGGALGRYLTPLVGLAKKLKENEEAAKLEQPEFVRLLTEESVKQSMRHIASTEVIKDNWAGKASPLSGKVMKKISIHGWVHDVGTGKLRDLNVSLLPPDEEA